MVDKDADGRITPRELMSVMKGLGFKSHDILVKEMIARFDADGIWLLQTVTVQQNDSVNSQCCVCVC